METTIDNAHANENDEHQNQQNGSPSEGLHHDDEEPTSPTNHANDDVVESELTDTAVAQAQLVEGDFFPEDMSVDPQLIAQLEVVTTDTDAEEPGSNSSISIRSASRESSVAQSRMSYSSSQAAPQRAVQKRGVVWADDQSRVENSCAQNNVRRLLVRHVTTFYMAHSSHVQGYRSVEGESISLFGSPTLGTAGHSSVHGNVPVFQFKEKENTDGSVYLFCKAQRPSMKFTEWRRQAHASAEVPFGPQPNVDTTATAPRTLFAKLYPPAVGNSYNNMARQHQTVRMRTARRADEQARCPQMPFMRVDKVYNEPLSLPL